GTIKFWHGWITPLYMSLIVVGVGIVLFIFRKSWQGIYKAIPGKLSLNKAYDFLLDQSEKTSAKITNSYMTGSIHQYLVMILVAIFLCTVSVLWVTDGFAWDTSNLAEITTYEILIALVMA